MDATVEETATEEGDYTITVIAKGNGAWISDSTQSNMIEFTIAPQAEPQPEPAKSCFGTVTGGSIMALVAVAGMAFVAKKRKED